MPSDIDALREWKKLTKPIQRQITGSVFCVKCGVTTIVDYDVTSDPHGIVLQGKCVKCGNRVARLIEND